MTECFLRHYDLWLIGFYGFSFIGYMIYLSRKAKSAPARPPPTTAAPPSIKPDLTEREKSVLALKSSGGITVIDALRLIDRLEQDTVVELAIFVLESWRRGDPTAKELLTETFRVGSDGGVSTGQAINRLRCDVCGKLSPAARSVAAAGECATDLGWQVTDERDLCPEHKLQEPS